MVDTDAVLDPDLVVGEADFGRQSWSQLVVQDSTDRYATSHNILKKKEPLLLIFGFWPSYVCL